ncbi:MAG: glycosyltransferase family 2 protein [Cyclobacteriaceae bacterium]
MILSVIIPAYNEAANIKRTTRLLHRSLIRANIPHEILVINDNSQDETEEVLNKLQREVSTLRYINSTNENGFGFAVREGLDNFKGDCVAIFMADCSDSPDDLVTFYNEMVNGDWDCVFGSRFIKGGHTHGYPYLKLIINRIANNIVRLAIGRKYNDYTNAFKLYQKKTIDGLRPFLSPHFNLTLELPLKAIVRGYNYTVIPNSWTNRIHGKSNLKIKEMGSRYFFILLYCLIEKFFSRGDYKKTT